LTPEDVAEADADDEVFRALDVLELRAPVTNKEIQGAYKKKMAEYHPDKVADRGAKLRQVAEEETKRITAAFRLLKERGLV